MRVNFKDVLMALPYSERLAMLMCSILDHDKHNAVVALINLVRATYVLSRYLSVEQKFHLAERMRDFADQIERQSPCVSITIE